MGQSQSVVIREECSRGSVANLTECVDVFTSEPANALIQRRTAALRRLPFWHPRATGSLDDSRLRGTSRTPVTFWTPRVP